jgi:hypothetical protein
LVSSELLLIARIRKINGQVWRVDALVNPTHGRSGLPGSALTGLITHATNRSSCQRDAVGLGTHSAMSTSLSVGPGWQLSGTCVLVSRCVVGLEMNELCLGDCGVLAYRLQN